MSIIKRLKAILTINGNTEQRIILFRFDRIVADKWSLTDLFDVVVKIRRVNFIHYQEMDRKKCC